MPKTSISQILNSQQVGEIVSLEGWVRTFRSKRFIALNDGSCQSSIQCVVEYADFDEEFLKRITTGSCISLTGNIVASKGQGQSIEIEVKELKVLGDCSSDLYPIQPKRHSLEFLREKAHLRMRTNTFSAVMRIRHTASFAVHEFFNENGFFNLHTPIITSSDA